jgi:T5SS/PEP-CTERM-associated repeat protein/autotransporter-associated beta strand protein
MADLWFVALEAPAVATRERRNCRIAALLATTALRHSRLGSVSMTSFAIALAAATTTVHATDWTGATSTNWFTAGNWSAGVPNFAVLANIDTVTPNATVVGLPGAQTPQLFVGVSGTGTLTIQNGGTVNDSTGIIGFNSGSTGTVTVTGAGSTWANNVDVYVGIGGSGTLTIQNGGAVTSVLGANIGRNSGSTGTVTVTGTGSSWTNTDAIVVGNSGAGTLTIQNGGTVSTGGMLVAIQAGSTGTLNIGAASGQAAAAPGTLNVSSVAFGGGTGLIVFNHTASNYVFAPAVSGPGSVTVEAGTTILTANNTYTGATTVNGGLLSVNGTSTGSAVTVNAGGTLGGTGTVGSTTINGGTLAPGNSIGLLTVQGNLVFTAASSYMIEVSPANADRTNVTGTATLGGATVNASFAAGSYAIRSYDILHSASLNGTTFSGVSSSNPNFAVSLSYTPTDVFLNLTGATLGAGAGLNQNQQNVANAINGFFNGGGTLPPGFGTLFGLTGGNLAAALSQASGEVATGSQQTTFNAMACSWVC